MTGPTTITRALFGSGNHCLTWFGGDVTCDLFYPENHAFELAGRFTPRAGVRHRHANPRLDRTGAGAYDDEGPELVDDGALEQRIRTGQPLR